MNIRPPALACRHLGLGLSNLRGLVLEGPFLLEIDRFKGKLNGKIPYLMGKSMVSG
jgi:hypothetical protein